VKECLTPDTSPSGILLLGSAALIGLGAAIFSGVNQSDTATVFPPESCTGEEERVKSYMRDSKEGHSVRGDNSPLR
jgi:hypothetical protein